MRLPICVVLAGCGGTAAPPRLLQHHVAAAPLAPPVTWHYRQIELGSARPSATRTTFELAIEADRATLVERHEHARGSFTLATLAQAAWAPDGQVVYTGTRRAGEAGTFVLELEAPGVQPLRLACRDKYIRIVAAADAPRLPLDCGGKLFSDDHLTFALSLLCGGELPQAGDDDDADQLCFANAPGVERVDVNDGCELGQVGLRLAPAPRR